MKVIDLLNKIANGEEVPEKIRYNNIIYNWDIKGYLHYEDEYHSERAFLEGYRTDMCLNDEVEILEEEKKITPTDFENLGYALGSIQKYINKGYDKALEEKKIPKKLNWVDYNIEFTHKNINKEFRIICNTIDEIIDYLKSKGDE